MGEYFCCYRLNSTKKRCQCPTAIDFVSDQNRSRLICVLILLLVFANSSIIVVKTVTPELLLPLTPLQNVSIDPSPVSGNTTEDIDTEEAFLLIVGAGLSYPALLGNSKAQHPSLILLSLASVALYIWYVVDVWSGDLFKFYLQKIWHRSPVRALWITLCLGGASLVVLLYLKELFLAATKGGLSCSGCSRGKDETKRHLRIVQNLLRGSRRDPAPDVLIYQTSGLESDYEVIFESSLEEDFPLLQPRKNCFSRALGFLIVKPWNLFLKTFTDVKETERIQKFEKYDSYRTPILFWVGCILALYGAIFVAIIILYSTTFLAIALEGILGNDAGLFKVVFDILTYSSFASCVVALAFIVIGWVLSYQHTKQVILAHLHGAKPFGRVNHNLYDSHGFAGYAVALSAVSFLLGYLFLMLICFAISAMVYIESFRSRVVVFLVGTVGGALLNWFVMKVMNVCFFSDWKGRLLGKWPGLRGAIEFISIFSYAITGFGFSIARLGVALSTIVINLPRLDVPLTTEPTWDSTYCSWAALTLVSHTYQNSICVAFFDIMSTYAEEVKQPSESSASSQLARARWRMALTLGSSLFLKNFTVIAHTVSKARNPSLCKYRKHTLRQNLNY